MLIPFMFTTRKNPQLSMEPLRESHLKTLNNLASRLTAVTNEACSALTKAVDDMAQFYDVYWKDSPW